VGGELQPIAAARFDLGLELTYSHKIAIIVAITKEIVRSTDDRALSVLEALIVRALRLAEDRALLSSDAAVGTPASFLPFVPRLRIANP
jgi:hypothetical protein